MTKLPTLLFATNNENKVREMQAAIGNSIRVMSLKEAGLAVEIPEPHETLEENASEKSAAIYALTGMSCFSEDTGLEVTALQGRPGVRSARFAGESCSDEDNIKKLMEELSAIHHRQAQFRTVISLIWSGKEQLFEGICRGTIAQSPKGSGGFGYDPVFIPEGSERCFGEMSLEEKNTFSHRKKAAEGLVRFLQQQMQIPTQV